MSSFRDLRSAEDIATYTANLNSRWPEREQVIQHISDKIKALPFAAPQVIELCPGPGQLADFLLRESSQLDYIGIDFSVPLLTFTRERLASFGRRARLIRADLNQDEWVHQLPGEIHAIISMQSLHDLGGEAQVNRIYGLAQSLLVPGGLFLNADLVVPSNRDNPNNPGRRSIPRHLELLQAHGYVDVACTLELGGFGCVVGFAPHPSNQ